MIVNRVVRRPINTADLGDIIGIDDTVYLVHNFLSSQIYDLVQLDGKSSEIRKEDGNKLCWHYPNARLELGEVG